MTEESKITAFVIEKLWKRIDNLEHQVASLERGSFERGHLSLSIEDTLNMLYDEKFKVTDRLSKLEKETKK